MKIQTSKVRKLLISGVKGLDPVSVYLEDYGPGEGKITITCYGKAWTAYWGSMGDFNITDFFLSCNEHYITKNLSDLDYKIFDVNKIKADALDKGIECFRDDPWNDYEFLESMYGPDMACWHDSIPKMENPKYLYLCRIIFAVQGALKLTKEEAA